MTECTSARCGTTRNEHVTPRARAERRSAVVCEPRRVRPLTKEMPGRPGFSREECNLAQVGHENSTGQGKMDIMTSAEHIINADLCQITMIL